MYCPQCGQEQISDETRFCSRCGFLLTGIAAVMENGGLVPNVPLVQGSSGNSPRKKGLKQGLFIFLLTFLIVPLVAIISVAIQAPIWGIPITAILLTVGGLLRIAYALMFESNVGDGETVEQSVLASVQKTFYSKSSQDALPPQQSIPASDYVSPPEAGHWRDTNDLKTPASVTEETTKLLQKERDQ
jgi:hypothetical protein